MPKTVELPDIRNRSIPPGTVSKILWHFTGGPPSQEGVGLNQFGTIHREPSIAYDALRSILNERTLRLGRPEQHKARSLKAAFYAEVEDKSIEVPTFTVMETRPVCCLADIPIQHLTYHASKYGKFAIGFHRESVVNANFNPVFYAIDSREFVSELHFAIAQTQISQTLVSKYREKNTAPHGTIEYLNSYSQQVRKLLSSIISNMKSFGDSSFEDIYCEREWRSTEAYRFHLSDLAMVILPKKADDGLNYFARAVTGDIVLPRGIPIVPWEDLLEH